jgi:transcriptional regulator of acetoin/glycerol metabolism
VLQNRIHRAKLICTDGAISVEHLGLAGPATSARAGTPRATPATGVPPLAAAPAAAVGGGAAADPERASLEEALLKAGGVVSRAAAEMGLSRQALYRRMERAGIVLERRPKV